MTFAEIRLENFRGVKEATTIVLTRPGDGVSCNLILYGENGSGKSSFCDAFEFVARGVVSRRLRDGTKVKREIRNISAPKGSAPCVEVMLKSGETYRRGNKSPSWAQHGGDEPPYLEPGQTMPGYDLAPIVIRRSAVEAFWQIAAVQRQEFFWDYLRNPDEEMRTTADEQALRDLTAASRRLKQAGAAVRRFIPKDFRFTNADRPYTLPTHQHGMRTMRNAASLALFGETGRSLDASTSATLRGYEDALGRVLELTPLATAAQKRTPRDFAKLQAVLNDVGPRVSHDYQSITNQTWLTGVSFQAHETGALEILLARENGVSLAPETVMSEAHLDLLAVLIMIEVHIACSERGQSQFLVLDDVFQSIDAPLRSAALGHLATKLSDWQLVLTVHDRLWLDIAVRCLKEAGKPVQAIEIRNAGFGSTPTVIGVNPGHLRDLHHVVQSAASAVVVAGTAGRTFEALCHHLSVWCESSVRRKEGDKYTIGDLWPSVQESLRQCVDPDVVALADELGQSQFLRNIAGAHYTAWADGLSDAEALESARRVEKLHHKFWCKTCGRAHKRAKVTKRTWSISSTCGHT